MKMKFLNCLALAVIGMASLASVEATPHQGLMYNKCSGGGASCYCTHGCSASKTGCTCND
jgi:hypothetical protein